MGLPPGIFTDTDPGIDVPPDLSGIDGELNVPVDSVVDGGADTSIADTFNQLFGLALGGYKTFETITGRPGESGPPRPRDQGGPTGKGISGENKPQFPAISPTAIGWILAGGAIAALVLALVLKVMGKS